MHAISTTMTAVADKEVFLRLLEQHAGIIRKFAFGYTSTFADREDLTQEIVLQLWRAYPRYSRGRPFSTWMYRIALNVAISFLRRHTHPVRQTLSLEESKIEAVDETARDMVPDDRLSVLRQVIESLAPLDRGLMLLYLEDRSYREIAEVLGITETNVATKLNRLKQRVREEMVKLNRQNL
ncbi:MAG: RNA polymerase sigma factor [Chthoniobacterales bacterium]